MADGYLTFDTKLNTAGFKSGLGQVTGMFTKLAAAAGIAFSVAAVVNFGKASVQAASEMQAKFKGLEFLMRANGRSMQTATSFIKEFTADGLVPMTSAYEAYKNMVSRGYETDQIEKMLNVMKDAAVYARQGQFSMGEAIEKTTMGLRMENSLLTDSVGIQKNVAKMWAEYAKEIGTTANNLTMAQKRQAEFSGFMKEGGVFAGAAAEYAGTYAGKVATIGAAFKDLQIAVGNAVIPFINALLPAITRAILWFTKLFNIVGRVVNLLFGTNVGMADAEAAIAGSAEATAAATGETAANTEKAGKAAKGALASFDKLNVLAQDTASGGGGDGEGGGGGGMPMPVPDTEPTLGALDEMEERISTFVERVKAFFAPLGEAFGRLGKALGKVGEAVKGAFERFFPGGIDFGPFIALVRDGVIFIIDLLAKAIEGFANWINENPDAFNVLLVLFAGLAIAAAAVYAPALLVIAAVVALLAALGWLANNWDLVKEKASEAWEIIKTSWNKAGEWFKTSVIDPVANFFKGLWGKVSGFFVNLWEDIKAIWQTVKDWFEWNVINPVVEFFFNLWQSVSGYFSNLWADIQTVWNTVSTWFQQNVIDPVKTAFETAFDAIKGFMEHPFEGLGEFVKGVFNNVIDFINGLLAGITSGINGVIDRINGLSFTPPQWAQDLLGVGTIGFNINNVSTPQIPRLATGAVIPPNAPFMAVMGDQRRGTNLEAPESLIRQIVREESGGAGAQNITITFGGTMGELVRQLKPHVERENSRVGNTMLAQAVRVS